MLTDVGFRTVRICAALALTVVGLSAQNAVPIEDVRARYRAYMQSHGGQRPPRQGGGGAGQAQ